MLGRPRRAWGKLRPVSGVDGAIEWHPLVDHCADVAACVEALLAQPTVAARLGLDGRDRVGASRLAALAFLHDLGKANLGFQNKQYRQKDGRYPREIAGHVREVAPLFQRDRLSERLSATLPLETIDSWGRGATVYNLRAASISHHGTPVDPSLDPEFSNRSYLWQATPDGCGWPTR